MAHRILMIVTSADALPSGHETGVWLEEFAVPYQEFIDRGSDVTVASPHGGAVPVDPMSLEDVEPDQWGEAREALKHTRRLSEQEASSFDAIFFPGGHGPLVDLPDHPRVKGLVRDLFEAGGVVGAMCHGPAGLLEVSLRDGRSLLDGRNVTGFTNAEEDEVGLTDEVPYLLEDALKERGARFSSGGVWADHVVADGRLVTGQNPQSSRSAARKLLEVLERTQRSQPEARS